MKIIKLLTSLLIASALFFALQNSAYAANCVWTGAASNVFNNAANWNNCNGNVPGVNDNVSITSSGPEVHLTQAATVAGFTIDDNVFVFDYDAITNGSLTVNDVLLVDDNAYITHAPATSAGGGTVVGTVSINVGDTASIDGAILAGQKGFPYSSGPGQGCDTAGGAGGGGYGGSGGRGAGCTTAGVSYGEFRNQNISLGSGGGEQQGGGYYGTSGAGGGAIKLNVAETLEVNGTIDASGESGTGNNGAGGSGGSILIDAGYLSGGGYITAYGGAGGPYAGGGAGGRIYIALNYSNSFYGDSFATAGTSGNYVPAGKPATDGTVVYYILIDDAILFESDITLTPADEPLEYDSVFVQENMYLQSDVVSGTRVGVHIEGVNFELNENASINAVGRGYPEGEGPGQGYDADGAAGGGYGGTGGSGYLYSVPGGDMYDTFQDLKTGSGRINIGSAGGVNTSGPSWGVSGAGGGGIWIEAGTLTLATGSAILADGANGAGNNGAGGSGGAILIETNTIEGSGSISANGGNGGNYAGGGGGGRIYISYTEDLHSGTITVAKGTTGAYISGKHATNGSAVMVDSYDNNLDILGSMTISADDGTIHYNDITIASNQTIYLMGTDLAGTGVGVTMTADGTFTLPSSSTISADGLGFPKQLGTGVGCAGDGAGGAAHGGSGLGGYGCGGTGTTYGNANGPVTLGSGGGNNTSGAGWGISGAGGGAIKIVAADMLINGTITANSGPAFNNNGGGGSGGSIWLDVSGEIDGSGIIRANGGNGQPYGGGGGGGRILIEYGTNSFSGTVTANGGIRGSAAGGGTAGSGSIVF